MVRVFHEFRCGFSLWAYQRLVGNPASRSSPYSMRAVTNNFRGARTSVPPCGRGRGSDRPCRAVGVSLVAVQCNLP